MKDDLFFEGDLLLQKMTGKGGWTYAMIPKITKIPNKTSFGWFKVKGKIDEYDIAQHSLMSMKNGEVFLAINANIRKAIKKEEGNHVHVKLFIDSDHFATPAEIMECLAYFPEAKMRYEKLSEFQKKQFIIWIQEAKTSETKDRRIAQMIEKLEE